MGILNVSHTLSYYLHLSKSIHILFAIWLQILENPSGHAEYMLKLKNFYSKDLG